MQRILVIGHRQSRRDYGGPVYTSGVLALLTRVTGARIHHLWFESAPTPWQDRRRKILAVIRSLADPLPARAHRFSSPAFARRIAEQLRTTPPDLVVINGADMLWCTGLLPAGVPRLYIAHNVEHRLQAASAPSWSRRGPAALFLRRDLAKLERYERDGIRACDGCIAVSRQDLALLRQTCPTVAGLWLPPLFTTPVPSRPERPAHPLRLGFLANLAWGPNRTSLAWFLSQVWPAVDHDACRLHLFGHASQGYAGAGIEAHGWVADLATVWQGVDLMVQPITVGGGVNIKMAETVYHRLPCLATPLALRGLGLTPDPAIAVADTAEAWRQVLTSGQARILAGRRPLASNAALFHPDHHAHRLHDFLAGVQKRR